MRNAVSFHLIFFSGNFFSTWLPSRDHQWRSVWSFVFTTFIKTTYRSWFRNMGFLSFCLRSHTELMLFRDSAMSHDFLILKSDPSIQFRLRLTTSDLWHHNLQERERMDGISKCMQGKWTTRCKAEARKPNYVEGNPVLAVSISMAAAMPTCRSKGMAQAFHAKLTLEDFSTRFFPLANSFWRSATKPPDRRQIGVQSALANRCSIITRELFKDASRQSRPCIVDACQISSVLNK